MILLDYSQLSISNVHQQLRLAGPTIQPNILKHMILNSIRKIKRDFGRDYGQIVICADGFQYWRKNIFPYYKAARKKSREESGIDWPLVFSVLKELREDIAEHFPYKVMHVPHCEADDVIAIMVKNFKKTEPMLIVSSDHDFVQLLDKNVAIYKSQTETLIEFSDK